jgi:NitT/TauT family transport system substrate-binding protein
MLARSRFLAIAGALATCGVPVAVLADNQAMRMTMASKTVFYAPYMIAIEKGYYSEEGLTPTVTMAGGGVATPAQLSGSIDINTSATSAVTPIFRGAALKLVYTQSGHPVFQLWSTSKTIKTLRDLKGLQVGVISRGDTSELSTKMALLKAGLPLDWVGYTALGGAGSLGPAFIARSLPAVVLADVDVINARRAGALANGNLVVNMMRDTPMPFNGIAVSDAFMATRREALLGFLRATLKGARYMRRFKNQTLAIVAKNSPNVDPELNALDYDNVMPLLAGDGTVAPDVLSAYLQVQAQMLDLPAPPVERVWDYRVVREANASLNRARWQPT